jgi:outer membrane receptor protein involved in Fe transport
VRDVAVQPRFNAEIQPRPWFRLRGGWGRTAKLPTVNDLSPAPQYYDVVNVNWYAADPNERLAVLTTFVRDPTNSELDMARGEKAELGFELGLARSIVSVVGFRDAVHGGFALRPEPTFLLRDHYELSDSTLGTGYPPEIIEPPTRADTIPILIDRPSNAVEVLSHGVELTAMLPEIRPIRTRIQIQGAWTKTERFTDALYFGPYSELTDFQLRKVKDRIPYWDALRENGWRALATYRVIHQEPDAGLVVSATIQHNILDRFKDIGGTDTLSFAGYLTRDGRLVEVPEAERTDPQYMDLRETRSGSLVQALSTPGDWMMSVQVSKTLPLEGHLSFWVYNLLDRAGTYGDANTYARLYPQMRFELTMPARGLVPW